jgi:hypothetical protein
MMSSLQRFYWKFLDNQLEGQGGFCVRNRCVLWATFGVSLLHAVLCFLTWNPHDIAYISDEGIYLTLGKSLALNGEYRSISWPEEPKHGKYPPIFPLLLSIVWKALPDFPRNVPWFRGLNIFLGTLSLWVLQSLLTKGCSLSWTERMTIVLLVALHPAMLFYSTSIHSEPVYLLISGGILWYAVVACSSERLRGFPWFGVWLGLLTGLLLYVRLAAVTLALAVLLYLLVLKSYRNFVLAGLIQIALLIPWLLWIGLNSTEMSHRGFAFYSDYFRDWRQVVHDNGLSDLLWRNGISLLLGIPKTCFFPFQTNLELITQLTFWLGIPFHYFLWRGFARTWKDGVNKLLHLYTLSSLIVFLAWPYMAQERFLGTLLPLFYLFFLKGASSRPLTASFEGRVIRQSRSLVSWSMMTMLLTSLGFHTLKYGYTTFQSASEQQQAAHACFVWIKDRTAPDDHLMADLDALFYLHTGRKVLPLALALEKIQGNWTVSDSAIRQTGAHYLVSGLDDFFVLGSSLRTDLRKTVASHLESNPAMFRRVFASPNGRYQIYSFSQGR